MDRDEHLRRARAAIEQLGPTDHVCILYDRLEEHVAIAASFLRAGLDRGDLCICVADEAGAAVLGELASEGVDIDSAMRGARLAVFERPFDCGLQPLQMLDFIEKHASGARSAGHTGSRIVGEMSWALGGDLTALAEFEARLNLNRVWTRYACAGLCQFDRTRFSPETLREMLILHPLVIVGDRVCRNPYYVPPEIYLSPDWPQHEANWIVTNLEQLLQAEEDVRGSQERYRALSRRLLEMQEYDRSALARELHDQLGQSLFSVSLTLDAIKGELSPASRARIPESMQVIEQMLEQVRTFAFELRPSALDDLGLVAALRPLVARHGERAGVHAIFTATPADVRAPAEIETACFRIVQEALTNAARHARAREVVVTLAVKDDALEVVVRDDGIGFEVDRRLGTGLGLAGMAERAALAGGQLDIESAPDAGTTLRVRFPLPQATTP